MTKGTTPTLYFKINNVDDLSTIADIRIAIKCGSHFLNKSLAESEIEVDESEKAIVLKLTEKETLAFTSKEAKIQIKILFTDNTVSVSPIFIMEIDDVLDLRPITPEPEEEEEPEEPSPEPEPGEDSEITPEPEPDSSDTDTEPEEPSEDE